MEIDFLDGERVAVTLSRRNLRSLLAKLDGHPPDSFCTIVKDTARGRLIVRAVEDEVAYRDDRCGIMHPATEVRLFTESTGTSVGFSVKKTV